MIAHTTYQQVRDAVVRDASIPDDELGDEIAERLGLAKDVTACLAVLLYDGAHRNAYMSEPLRSFDDVESVDELLLDFATSAAQASALALRKARSK